MRFLLDSNILIDYLRGLPPAIEAVKKYDDAAISVVSWIEVIAGGPDPAANREIESFLNHWPVLDFGGNAARVAADLRRTLKLRLPDAMILAAAKVDNRVLVTRNTKDFKPDWPDIVVPYVLAPH